MRLYNAEMKLSGHSRLLNHKIVTRWHLSFSGYSRYRRKHWVALIPTLSSNISEKIKMEMQDLDFCTFDVMQLNLSNTYLKNKDWVIRYVR